MSDDRRDAEVIDRKDWAPGLLSLRVRPTDGPVPAFEPGQFALLVLDDPANPGGKPLRRAYSIASPPGVDHLEFFVRLVDDGKATTRLWNLQPGDRVGLAPRITGAFTLGEVPAGRDVVAVATGTGLAPYLSMLRHYRGTDRWRRFVVVHACRVAADLGYREFLEQLEREDPTVVYIPTLSREPDGTGWMGERGRVQTVLLGGAYERRVGASLDPERCHVFLCGNPAMVDDTERVLAPLGFRHHTHQAPGNLHFERYW